MKIKNNIKKASIGLLVSAIAVSGAFAWLKSSETASKQNELVVGSIDIKFENQLNKVELSDNTAIPMTKAEAVATLTPYTFDIANKGSVYLDYVVSVDSASYQNTFPENGVNVLIAPIADSATDEEIKTALTNATVKKLTSTKDLVNSSLNISEHKRYAMIAYIDKGVKLAEYTGANLSFKLRVDAVQHNVLNAENYETLSKSQIATSITAGGETKNVEVYNIEGDSKADLLDKLDKSGLTDASTVDAIIEVKGEEYDGINSTATFDVSSIANPGDEVVILHYNETTQEWEYIGRETVAEDNTVSGNFTSYSPVAFIVYKPDGSTVTKEYDSVTGELIKETEAKTDGSVVEIEYDENGEVSNITKIDAPEAGGIDEQGYLAINEVNFPDEIFREYVRTEFDTDSDEKLSENERKNATQIYVENKGISSLKGVEYFTELTELHCSDNHITDLDVSHNTSLTYLFCARNELKKLDVSNNKNLGSLYCSENHLTMLDVSNNTTLMNLSCYDNQLTSLDISHNTFLNYLRCGGNQLTTLDVSNNAKLTILYCENSQLTSLNLTQNTMLKELYCSDNKLVTLDVSQNTSLIRLNCMGNQLTTLDLSYNTLLNSENAFADPSVNITYAS